MSEPRPQVSPSELTAIPVLQIPVPVWAQSQEHIDELLREFTLIAAAEREYPGPHDVPSRLMRLVDDLTSQYGGLNTDQENRLAEAAERGVLEIDLTYRVPVAARHACIELQVMLDEADAYCRAGEHLLTLATPPELVRFRNWFLEEFVRQLDGELPIPWPEYPK